MDLTARTLATGLGRAEGPVLTQTGEILVTSMDQGRVYRVDGDEPTIFAMTGGGANGATEGPDGVIYVAQNGGRSGPWHPGYTPGVTGGIQAITKDRHIDWVTLDMVSPNDLCFGPDGFLYVTDPTRRRTDDGRIWRCDIRSREADLLQSVPWFPNGVAFGLEDDGIYVASTFERTIWRFPLSATGLGRPDAAIRLAHGRPDGFAFDTTGNIFVAALPDGEFTSEIQVWTGEGKLLDVFSGESNQRMTNLAIGPAGELVVTDADRQVAVLLEGWISPGLALHPFRA